LKCSKCKNEAIDNFSLCLPCRTKKTERRLERKARGQCAYCTKLIVDGSSLCLHHSQLRSKQDSARLQSRKSSGICVSCGEPSPDKRSACIKCREKRLATFSERNAQNLCRYCPNDKLPNASYCAKCQQYHYNHSRAIRQKVLDRYGNKCVCCGETTYEFLAIDHIHNDGASERKLGISGPVLLRKIIAEGYPGRYQILCHNCNFAKQFSPSGCPHKKTQMKLDKYLGKYIGKANLGSIKIDNETVLENGSFFFPICSTVECESHQAPKNNIFVLREDDDLAMDRFITMLERAIETNTWKCKKCKEDFALDLDINDHLKNQGVE
jgi:hypothetical protein